MKYFLIKVVLHPKDYTISEIYNIYFYVTPKILELKHLFSLYRRSNSRGAFFQKYAIRFVRAEQTGA